jgi:conjugal transfer pilus assembly protein TraB
MAAMSSASTLDPASVKRKKLLVLTGVLGVILVLALAVSMLMGKKSPGLLAPPGSKIQATHIASPTDSLKPADIWRSMSEAQIRNLETTNRDQAETLKRLGEELAALKHGNVGESGRSLPVPGEGTATKTLPPLPPPPPPRPAGVAVGPESYNRLAAAVTPVPPPKGAERGVTRTASGIQTVSFVEAAVPTVSVLTDAKDTRRTVEHYIPSGSFTQAILLGGIDAPTGGQAQQNPQPIVAKLVDRSILPNKFRYDTKECFVVGAGYGDISAERGYVRLESLSCVLKNGTVIDVPVKGYIADETGKAGIRGRVVTKTGQVLANALLSGVAAGIGQAFSYNAQIVSTSPLGTTSTIDSDQIGQAAAGQGIATAMDRLADYYIRLAEQMFPVIEIDSGRKVDVVLTTGVDLGAAALGAANAAPAAAVAPRANLSNRPATFQTVTKP